VLYAYVEVYNLSMGGPPDDSFDLRYTVLDTSGGMLRRYPVKRIRKPGRTGAKGEVLHLRDFPRGAYVLRVDARDRLSGQRARAERRFQIVEPPRVLSVNDQDLEIFYDQIRYVATPKELKTYETLEPMGKIRFIQAFWRRRDPKPETPENEFLAEHLRRMGYADEHYGYLSQRGSDTDRGRIYIQYGPPDDVRREVMASENKPTEIWIYDQGQYSCVFRDRRGTGMYELVHSTIPGERRNPDWEEQP
jgi:GWxTD domain-containing protein